MRGRIRTTQQGPIAEHEAAKLFMIGSGSLLEVSWPATDDDRRDMETHIRGEFRRHLAFQIKSTTYAQHIWKARQIFIHFSVARARLISHPLFWYFFGYLDLKAMAFANPVFLVPSADVHQHAVRRVKGQIVYLNFEASLDPTSKDRWHTFQVAPAKVGQRVLQILKNLPLTLAVSAEEAAHLSAITGGLWIKRI